jgi:hypothetical protein
MKHALGSFKEHDQSPVFRFLVLRRLQEAPFDNAKSRYPVIRLSITESSLRIGGKHHFTKSQR